MTNLPGQPAFSQITHLQSGLNMRPERRSHGFQFGGTPVRHGEQFLVFLSKPLLEIDFSILKRFLIRSAKNAIALSTGWYRQRSLAYKILVDLRIYDAINAIQYCARNYVVYGIRRHAAVIARRHIILPISFHNPSITQKSMSYYTFCGSKCAGDNPMAVGKA